MRKTLLLVGAVTVAGSLSCGDGTGPGGPGSRQIAFASRDEANVWDIFVVNGDGSGLRNITRSAVEDLYPAWNRARTRIAFVSARPPGGVFVMNASGFGMRNVYVESDVDVYHLTWSPDGRSLAMEVAFRGEGRQIRRVDLDGSSSRPLIDDGFAPDWSPDGALIAFHLFVNSSIGNRVFVMNAADGTNVRDLGEGLDPSWSPDGQRIAFASGEPVHIWVMNADGSNPVQVSTGSGNDRVPVWSRDGQQIAFQRNTSIWVVNADGGEERDVSPSLAISGHPAW